MDINITSRLNNLPTYREFRANAGGAPKTSAQVLWEYGGTLTWFGYEGNAVTSQYSLRPVQWSFYGKFVRAAICFDVATHKDYRGKGIFTEIGRRAMSDAATYGIDFVYGFPNEQALPGHLKVGWKAIGEVPIYQAAMPHEAHDGFTKFKKVHEIPFNLTPEEVITRARMPSDDEWRFFSRPGVQYDVYKCKGGYFVTKDYWDESMSTRKFHLIDWVAKDDELDDIACFFLHEARVRGAAVATTICSDEADIKVLKENGFSMLHTGRQFIVNKISNKVDDRVYDLKNYHLTMGDTDVF